jgi:hypothetical protein
VKKDLSKVKKPKISRYIWPAILILVIAFLAMFILFAHRPGHYDPIPVAEPNQVSRYLTGELLPTIYNGAQRGAPFDVVITQEGINDILARELKPIKLQNVTLARPQVLIMPEAIKVMTTVEAKPVDFFLTIELAPTINEGGLLNLHTSGITLGAVNITPVAKSIGEKAYSSWMSSTGIEPNNIAAQVCRSLLRDEPFEPVFKVGGRTLRVSKVDVASEKMTVLLTPVSD